MPRKKHAADIHTETQIARAVSFTIYLRKSPHEVFRETAASIPDARAVESRMNADHGKNGRRAIVYAITPERVNHFVPDHMQ